jgi:hypothetical protein
MSKRDAISLFIIYLLVVGVGWGSIQYMSAQVNEMIAAPDTQTLVLSGVSDSDVDYTNSNIAGQYKGTTDVQFQTNGNSFAYQLQPSINQEYFQ